MIRRTLSTFAAGVVISSLAASGISAQSTSSRSADSAAIVATVEQFHASLAKGDSAGAARVLSPDLTVMEAGGVERLADYLAHHLGGDMEYAKAVPSRSTLVSVSQQGDVAWVVSTSVTRGTFRDRPVNSNGAELMVLARAGGGWMIRSVHWSSRRVNP